MTQAENQGEEIRPCLIGGFRAKNSPIPYVHPIDVDGAGRVVSVDMVRVRLDFPSADIGVDLAGRASLLQCDIGGYASYTAPLKPGRYRVLSTYGMGESSVSLGIGLVGGTNKVDMAQGFVEFNPNKLGDSDMFRAWCARVGMYVKGAELVRWDLAYDVPVDRANLRLEKDRRHYRLEQGAALTEYLGVRNSAGYVKVYDKAAEAGLSDVALTRVEMTCKGTWTLDVIAKHWPTVYGVRAGCDGLSNANKMLVGLLADKVRSGGTVEPELKTLCKDTRRKIRAALEDVSVVQYPRAAVAQAIAQAHGWAHYFEV